MSLNNELSELFSTMAKLMEIKGEPVFKSIAFSKVSRILGDMTLDIRGAYDRGELGKIAGVGASSQRVIAEYIATGKSTDHDELSASVPAGLLPMLDIPGMGPKTIHLLWKERDITTIDALATALDDGSLVGIKGLGDKKLQGMREGIALRATAGQRVGIVEAMPVAEVLLERLRKLPQVKRAEVAGSLRRQRETIGDVDIVCVLRDADGGAELAKLFTAFPEADRTLAAGSTKASIVTARGLQIDLRMMPADSFGAAILYFTGSKEHNVRIRGLALDKGLTLNEWGLYKLGEESDRSASVAGKDEEGIYRKLGMAFVPPELREDRGEVEAAIDGTLPELIELADVQGDLHTHTTASDGTATIEQMAEAAIARGYQFLGITDHSRSQVIANGLSVERLLAHAKEIRRVNDKYKEITLLAGCEVDILTDGTMDYEDAVLAELDYVIGSPHAALKQSADKATDRLLRAIDNRYVRIIGHPTGRMIGRRDGLSPDFGRLFKAAADSGTALEINASYPRLDLNDLQSRAAINAKVMLSINTDAHSTDGLDDMRWGIGVARRAWATKKNVINCMSAKKISAWLSGKK